MDVIVDLIPTLTLDQVHELQNILEREKDAPRFDEQKRMETEDFIRWQEEERIREIVRRQEIDKEIQDIILDLLYDKYLNRQQIAKQSGIWLPTVSETLDSMERAGVIQITTDNMYYIPE